MVSLKAPTCRGENTSKPRFMRMNELPQINESTNKMTIGKKGWCLFSMAIGSAKIVNFELP